jgi:preprotein translocase subunit YajC
MVMLVLMVVIFYFLLIRPQQKRQKEHRLMIEALKTGDRVVTSSGIHGVVANIKDKTVIVKIAENTKIEIDRASVAVVLKDNA